MFCSNRIHLTSCTLFNKDTVDKLPVRDTSAELGNFVELLSLQEVSVIFYPHMHFIAFPYASMIHMALRHRISLAKKHWRRSANSWVPGRNSAQATRLESNQKSPNSFKFQGYVQIKIYICDYVCMYTIYLFDIICMFIDYSYHKCVLSETINE